METEGVEGTLHYFSRCHSQAECTFLAKYIHFARRFEHRGSQVSVFTPKVLTRGSCGRRTANGDGELKGSGLSLLQAVRMRIYIYIYMAIYGHIRLCTDSGYVRIYIWLYIWPYMAIYGYTDIYGHIRAF